MRNRFRVNLAGLVAAIMAAGVISACSAARTPAAPLAPAGTATTVVASTTTSEPGVPLPAVPATAQGPFRVVEVVDGDTIKTAAGPGSGSAVTWRLTGLDTPELKDPRKPVQCFAAAASAQAHALLDGQQVRIEPDPGESRDVYGRSLGFVWLPDGRLFQEVMIAAGFGHEYTYEGRTYEHQDVLKAAEARARAAGAGLWSPSTCNGDTTKAASGGPSTTAATVTTSKTGDVHFSNCSQVRAAGKAPIHPGDPGWDPKFDADHDGIGCE